MSLQTRTDVLESLRYKPTDNSFEYVVLFFMGYALFTRSMSDLGEYWLPFYIALVALYAVAGVLFRVFDRKMPDVWDLLYWSGGTFVFGLGMTLYMYGLVLFVYDIWHWVTTSFDPLTNRTQFIVGTGLATIGVGGIFFAFRLRKRFLYGLTEACVGILVAMHRVTMEEWPGAPKSTAFYVALLTAGIYLVVRGLDNMSQAVRDGDPTGLRFVNFFVPKPKPITIVRLRAHRNRQRPVRKKAKPVRATLNKPRF